LGVGGPAPDRGPVTVGLEGGGLVLGMEAARRIWVAN
jgi:hypothetical protein